MSGVWGFKTMRKTSVKKRKKGTEKSFSDQINNLASFLLSFEATYSYIYTRVTTGGNESGRKFKLLETF